jgi:hypothetical protein
MRHASKRSAGRRRLGRALLLVPAAAAVIALVGTLPFNNSRQSPLHPIHQLIFPPQGPTAADNVRLRLASASQALDHAIAASGSERDVDLEQARQYLADARVQLVQVTDLSTRSELDRALSNLERRVTELAEESDDHDGQAGTGDQGQDKGHDQGDGDASDEPTTDPTDDGHGQDRSGSSGDGAGLSSADHDA